MVIRFAVLKGQRTEWAVLGPHGELFLLEINVRQLRGSTRDDVWRRKARALCTRLYWQETARVIPCSATCLPLTKALVVSRMRRPLGGIGTLSPQQGGAVFTTKLIKVYLDIEYVKISAAHH